MSASNEVVALFMAADVFFRFQNPTTGEFGNPVKIEVEKLEVNTPSDLKEKTSRGRATFGQTHTSHRAGKPTEFSVTFSQQNKDVFALAIAGAQSSYSKASATMNDHSVTVVLDEWVDVGYTDINLTGFTVENAAGTVTYVKDVDYELNPRLGLIKALSSGAIVAGAVKLNGTTNAVTGVKISGGKVYKQVISIEVDGLNQINNKDVRFSAWQGSISPESAKDFLSGELDSVACSGRLEIAPGKDSPFEMLLLN